MMAPYMLLYFDADVAEGAICRLARKRRAYEAVIGLQRYKPRRLIRLGHYFL